MEKKPQFHYFYILPIHIKVVTVRPWGLEKRIFGVVCLCAASPPQIGGELWVPVTESLGKLILMW